jgi:hypothetical protein
MSARSTKRWGRWFVFAWIAISLSTALLPCREVLAAVAAKDAVLHPVCGQHENQVPDSGGERKSKACLNLSAPARVPAERLAAASVGSVVNQLVAISVSSRILSPPRAHALQPAYRTAPPPLAVYLRSSRLLI